MESEVVVGLLREALFIVVLSATVIILPSLIVGLVVSVFQAATQINEQTLSFLPRLLMTMLSILIMGPWLASRITDFTNKVIQNIPYILN